MHEGEINDGKGWQKKKKSICQIMVTLACTIYREKAKQFIMLWQQMRHKDKSFIHSAHSRLIILAFAIFHQYTDNNDYILAFSIVIVQQYGAWILLITRYLGVSSRAEIHFVFAYQYLYWVSIEEICFIWDCILNRYFNHNEKRLCSVHITCWYCSSANSANKSSSLST